MIFSSIFTRRLNAEIFVLYHLYETKLINIITIKWKYISCKKSGNRVKTAIRYYLMVCI